MRPTDEVYLTEAEIKTLIRDTVKEVLVEVGAGDNVSDMQRDFIFLREQRLGASAIKKAMRRGILGLIIGAIPGILWLAFSAIHK